MSDYLNVISLAGLAPEDRFPTWRVVMERKAQGAETFEIHCWDQDEEGMELALRYGVYKDVNWPNGKVITGQVTEEFIPKALKSGRWLK